MQFLVHGLPGTLHVLAVEFGMADLTRAMTPKTVRQWKVTFMWVLLAKRFPLTSPDPYLISF